MSAASSALKTACAPLKHAGFRLLFLTSFAAWLGGWTQDVACAWLMTSIAPAPIMVALIQTATYLPFFLLSLPAGALADLLDRRMLLFFAQLWIFLAVIGLGLLTLTGAITSWLLLAMILIIGLGCAMSAPAWNSLAPELVPRAQLEPAIALNTAGFNLARGAGAALGGLLVAVWGPGWVFMLNAITMLPLIFGMYLWKREPDTRPPERVTRAMKSGIRYVGNSAPLRAVLVRTVLFVTCSSALWALLPLVVRMEYKLSAIQYGFILSAFGIGTLAGALIVPRFRAQLSQNQLAAIGTILFAASMGLITIIETFPFACLAMFLNGIGWIAVNAALNASLILAAPMWVRARAVAIFLLVFQGCFAGGSLLWGILASCSSSDIALQTGAVGLMLGLVLSPVFSLDGSEKVDLTTQPAPAEPAISVQPHPDHGPVLIQVEYAIETADVSAFSDAMVALESRRRRDGAFRWHLFCDLSSNGRYIEEYYMDSWGEYLRQRERSTADDLAVERQVYGFHRGDEPPKVSYLISEKRRSTFVTQTPAPTPSVAKKQDTLSLLKKLPIWLKPASAEATCTTEVYGAPGAVDRRRS